jgi:predicted RNase H-like HicB family nuclease
MKTISFIVEKTNTGFSAYAQNFETLPVGTTGDTITELKQNILEAANLYLEHISKKPITIEQVAITFDIPSFFDYYTVINAKALSKRIGMNNTLLSQYVQGVKKPSEKQVEKILAGIKDIGKELSELDIAS